MNKKWLRRSVPALLCTERVDGSPAQQDLQFAGKDDYHAKSTAVAGVYKISGRTRGLDKSIDDFKKRRSSISVCRPDNVELQGWWQKAISSPSGSDWWSNGKRWTLARGGDHRKNPRSLREQIPDTGFTTSCWTSLSLPTAERTNRKSSDSKNGDKYLAHERTNCLFMSWMAPSSPLQKTAA